MAEITRGQVITGAQYVLAVGALVWLFSRVDWGRLWPLLSRLRPGALVALVAVTVVGLVGRFLTWNALIRQVSPVTLREAGEIDLTVNFINQLLPSRLSGRSAAPLVVRQYTGVDWSDAVAIAGVHTGLYAVLYGTVSVVGLGLSWRGLTPGVAALVALSSALYLVAGVAVIGAGTHLGVVTSLTALVERVAAVLPVGGDRVAGLTESVPDFAEASMGRFRSLVSHPRTVGPYVVGWVGIALFAPGVRVWLLFDGFGVAFSPVEFLPLYLLMAYSVTLLPLTPGGIGVTEATATLVFVSLGVPETVAVSAIFIDRLVGHYVPSLVGALPATRIDLSGFAE